MMKMQILFLRRKAKRKPTDMPVTDWTVRDWADLPTHHPRRD